MMSNDVTQCERRALVVFSLRAVVVFIVGIGFKPHVEPRKSMARISGPQRPLYTGWAKIANFKVQVFPKFLTFLYINVQQSLTSNLGSNNII